MPIPFSSSIVSFSYKAATISPPPLRHLHLDPARRLHSTLRWESSYLCIPSYFSWP
ncbi:unnamed protein product [Darwinula stevensoni]|uniref:Uncharacterized protein n=1 Tax=Darwinula stevensoni TaxID=69355 RepID=A0A7R8X2Y7_9CRUS|nr:unnamed protein product [Darwinula stevensoni]CAG0883815.1 unnamed protein product [Darwinula stevensoni]